MTPALLAKAQKWHPCCHNARFVWYTWASKILIPGPSPNPSWHFAKNFSQLHRLHSWWIDSSALSLLNTNGLTDSQSSSKRKRKRLDPLENRWEFSTSLIASVVFPEKKQFAKSGRWLWGQTSIGYGDKHPFKSCTENQPILTATTSGWTTKGNAYRHHVAIQTLNLFWVVSYIIPSNLSGNYIYIQYV